MPGWEVRLTAQVETFLDDLYETDRGTHEQVMEAMVMLEEFGPALGRPLVDTLRGSAIRNLKEQRPASRGRSEIRIVFAFDPWRAAVWLVAGDKSGAWNRWYRTAIRRAEAAYEAHLIERREGLET